MKSIPSLIEANKLLSEAKTLNPSLWVEHSINVAKAASLIAKETKDLNPSVAYILGLLHDIGRKYGNNGMRHSILGYDLAARICISHAAFTYNDKITIVGSWNGTKDEHEFMINYLNNITFDDYDKLIKLCDYLSLPSGFCLIEKRLVDMTLRRGFNDLTIPRWESTFEIKQYFENKINKSIYSILPNVIENTFDL